MNAGTLYDSIHRQLFTLPRDTLVFPSQDHSDNTVSTIKQERAKNTRLGRDRIREEFVEIMRNLDLPYPRYIENALPANRDCGLQDMAAPDPGIVPD